MSKIIIIGNGPAGISAALYTTRAGIETVIIGKDNGALMKAQGIENYYGFREPISGNDLIVEGIEQAKRIGATVLSEEVFHISYDGSYQVHTNKTKHMADAIIIATGTSRATPNIKGLHELEGRGISYCAVCDAFFYRNMDVAVLGDSEYALHEAMELLPTSRSVTLLTNGRTPIVDIPPEIQVNTSPIQAFEGNDILEQVIFKDGNVLPVAGVFIALGVAGSTALAKKLGLAIEKNKILVDYDMATNMPGVYAAGDCTGGLLQISKAVYEGAKAGTSLIKFLRKDAFSQQN